LFWKALYQKEKMMMPLAKWWPLIETHNGRITFKDERLSFWEVEFPSWESRQAFVKEACERGNHIEWVFNTAGMRTNCVYVYPRD
jgi:hypothetical protein